MARNLLAFCAVMLGAMLIAGPSLAQRSGPQKAKKFQSNVVTAYDPCTVPDDSSGGLLPLPACSPAVPEDGLCTIDVKGGGKIQAKVDAAGDIAIKVKVKKIANCDGETVTIGANLRITTNNCLSADPNGCTVVDQPSFNLVTTTITSGQISVNTTVNAEAGMPIITAGQNTSFEITGADITRTTGASDPGVIARSGVVVY